MNILEKIEAQPQFPHEDLTAHNAAYLGLMMANRAVVLFGHVTAEHQYPIFTGTHKPLTIASGNIFSQASQLRGIEFGIQAFEAVTAFVRADRPSPDFDCLENNIAGIIKPSHVAGVREYFEHAQGTFVEQVPRTAAIIAESASRYQLDKRLAIFGGAVARQFELDNIED